jgi:signal transduction histidine kinase
MQLAALQKSWFQEKSPSPLVYPANFLQFEQVVFGFVCVAQIISPRLPWSPSTILLTSLILLSIALLLKPPLQANNGLKLAYVIGSIAVTFLAVLVFRPLVALPFYLGIALKTRFLLGRIGARRIGGVILLAFVGNVIIGENLGLLDKLAPPDPWIIAFSGTILIGIGIWGASVIVDALAAEQSSRLQAEALAHELSLANQRLVEGARQAEALATSQERNRIAREIHDSLGHCLTALNIQIEASLKLASRNPERSAQALAEAKRLGSEALQEVRRSVRALRPQMLESQSFSEALQHLSSDFERNTGIPVAFNVPEGFQLEPPYTDALFRVVQEGLTNIARYSQASQVELGLQSNSHGCELVIKDNGCGFDPKEKRDGFGLWSIRERVEAVSGKLEIHAAPGSGCQLYVWVPADGHH